MTLAEYHAHPAVSRSKLWLLKSSPLKFQYGSEHPDDPTPSMILGQAFHKLVLEPDTFYEEFAIIPEGLNRRTSEGRMIYAEFAAMNAGKTFLGYDDYETICWMEESLLANPTARKIIENGVHEHSIFWDDPETGEALKCRPDIFIANDELHIIADLKTTTSAETDAFRNTCVSMGYAMQAAMYTDGVRTEHPGEYAFLFLAVEKKPPYAVNVMQVSDEMMEFGRLQYRGLVELLHECREKKLFYGYNGKDNIINTLTLPAWAYDRMQ